MKTVTENVCSICRSNAITSSHEVCNVCFNKVKINRVHSYQYLYREHEYQHPNLDSAQRKLLVDTIASHEVAEWEKITHQGLSAAFVAATIVDSIVIPHDMKSRSKVETDWRQRHFLFISDCIDFLDKKLFHPLTPTQVEVYKKAATHLWQGNINSNELKTVIDYRQQHSCYECQQWQAENLLGWMMWAAEPDDRLEDWAHVQFMEHVYTHLKEVLADDVWMMLFDMHFHDIIGSWVEKDPMLLPHVSPLELLTHPEEYHLRQVRVCGIGNIEFEGDAIYSDKKSWNQSDYDKSLWLDFSPNAIQPDSSEYNGQYVIVDGTFDRYGVGHMSLWKGALIDITHYRAWNLYLI